MSELTDDLPRGRGGATDGTPGPRVECADVHDLTAGFAFGALDANERLALEHHCRRCPPCAFVLDQARQTATLLSFVVPPLRPPAHVKATLFSRIAHSSRYEPAAEPAAPPVPAVSPLPATPAPFRAAAGERTGNSGRRRLFPRLNRPWQIFSDRTGFSWQAIATPLATVPLVLALAIVGGFAVTAQSRVSDLRQDLSAARGEADRLRATVDAMDGFVRSDDALVYRLPARGGSTDTVGKVVVNPGTTEAMLLVWGLPPATDGASYQVYLEGNGGKMVRAGQFHVDADGRGSTVLNLDQPFTDYESVHVQPTGRPQLGQDAAAGSAVDTLAARIDPNVGELLDTDPPSTR